ncbi:LPXTG cell wall anchor domain-containing protein [Companilactobacillus crustorum]|uniref:LPXTG cell wall anchor domain-containing protein n=1 Tax=Companilactobacillus crustorum TaxID=392416 RepID=UPI00237D38F4|nr:LPXTG cell wall anchor domain-containing protein [Companilactobacillus crustorum]WDT65571.1 LPXTG cell wall anchor domain-containing protein [Companilactobacillus crustorum]
MMKKLLISLLSVGMLLGIFGVIGLNNTGSPNLMEETVQADTNNSDNRTINYEVYKENSNTLSPMNTLFTKSAKVYANDDGTYKVTVTGRVANLGSLDVSTIDGQTPKVTNNGNNHVDISFNVDSLNDLDKDIPATIQTKLLNFQVDQQNVTFRFDLSTLDSSGTNSSFADSLNKITNAENNITNTANNFKGLLDNLNSNSNSGENIISTPTTTDDNSTTKTNSDTNDSSKTVLKELTYKIAKNNGDGSLISPYFTNTAKVMENPDGTYYVEVTVKYPKKFGNKAFEINSINHQKPFNFTFKSEGDSNYITFDFPINKIADLSNLIPGNITLNVPDFGLNKDLGFNLDFDSLNPSDLSSLLNSSDTSGLLSDLSSLSKISDIKPVTTSTSNKSTNTLPKTGNETNYILMAIGGVVLVLWIVLLKGTYFKH